MLVLSRKVGEKLVIGGNITVVVNRIAGNRVTLGIEAPGDIRVMRGELKKNEELPITTVATPAPVAALTLPAGTFETHADSRSASVQQLAK